VVSFTLQPLYSQKSVHGSHWLGGWLGFTAGLDVVAKRKNLYPGWESKSNGTIFNKRWFGNVWKQAVVVCCKLVTQRFSRGAEGTENNLDQNSCCTGRSSRSERPEYETCGVLEVTSWCVLYRFWLSFHSHGSALPVLPGAYTYAGKSRKS